VIAPVVVVIPVVEVVKALINLTVALKIVAVILAAIE